MNKMAQTLEVTRLEEVAAPVGSGSGTSDLLVGERRPGMVFVKTKEYQRFIEMCEECRRSQLIGLCYGAAGVGKTEAGRAYARWDEVEPLLSWHGVVQPRLSPENPRPSAAFYTPTATVTARQIEHDLALLRWRMPGDWGGSAGSAARGGDSGRSDTPGAGGAADCG